MASAGEADQDAPRLCAPTVTFPIRCQEPGKEEGMVDASRIRANFAGRVITEAAVAAPKGQTAPRRRWLRRHRPGGEFSRPALYGVAIAHVSAVLFAARFAGMAGACQPP